MTVQEAFDLFVLEEVVVKNGADKTRRNYITAKNSILAAIGDIPINLFTLQHVSQWQQYMQSLGNQPNTIKANLSKLRSVLRLLKKRQYNVLDYRDIELPSVHQRPHTVLEYGEVQQLIDATENPRDRAIVACLFSTGCRVSELLNLNREDIVDGQAVVIGKGSKLRTVYFDDKALKLLDEYLETRKDKIPALFISGQYRRITVSRVEQIVHLLTAAAGIDKVITPHVFRHSTITDYITNGAPMAMVQRIAGHASIATTLNIYTHVQGPAIKQTFEKYHSH